MNNKDCSAWGTIKFKGKSKSQFIKASIIWAKDVIDVKQSG